LVGVVLVWALAVAWFVVAWARGGEVSRGSE
jgi:hypothetical protein